LELLEGGLNCGVLICGVLEFYDGQWQAVYEDHDVRASILLAFNDGELVDSQELVVLWVLEVYQAGVVACDGAVFALIFHGHAIDEHPMEGSVVGQKRGGYSACDFAEGLVKGVRWDGWVKAAEAIIEAASEEYLQEGLALSGWFFGGDVGTEDGGVAEGGEPGECGFFNMGFSQGHMGQISTLLTNTNELAD
jgi:hypothetical protein